MRSHRHLSIRKKLTLIVLVTCGVSILIACTLLAIYDLNAFRREIAVELTSTAEMTGANTTAALSFGDARSAHDTLSSLAAQTHIVSAAIYASDGSVFARYARAAGDAGIVPPKPGRDGVSFSRHSIVVFEPVRLSGERIGTVYLNSDLGQLYGRAKDFLEILDVVILACLLTAYLLASRLQRVISGPILALAETAATVSTGKNYSIRAAKFGNDEVGSLVDRFNDMLAQIQQRDDALQTAHDQLEVRVDQRTQELLTQVAEREQAERWLAERTSFLNSLIENSPIGIIAIDDKHAVQMCNPAFENLFGYKQPEILGRTLSEFLSSSELRDEVESNSTKLWRGETTHLVTRRRRKDGSMVDVEAFSVPLLIDGKITGALLLYQDITERRRAEEALLRAKEAAEGTSRAKSEFLANMSHEIRTPMNGIIGMTELALDTDLTAEQREYLGMVKTSAHSLLTVVNDILDFSKIEAGKLDLDPADFHFQRTVGETLKALAFRAHQKHLELAWRVAPDVPRYVKGDMGRLRQILVNLVGNSVKFTEHGEIVVSVDKESANSKGFVLHFQVRDTGIGIPRDKQQLVFDAFTQADSSASRRYGGTGLGLAITSRLVSLMGGRIWLESEVGRGSTFHFTCRFEFAETVSPSAEPADPDIIQNMPVLVVDDNDTNRRILVEMLATWGMKPECAESGAAALATLKRAHAEGRSFRLLIADMQMPEMDGCALSKEIRSDPALSRLPILILSSTGHSAETLMCRDLTVSGYLLKPAQPSDVLDAILAAVSRTPPSAAPPNQRTTLGPEPLHHRREVKILLAEDNAVNRKLAITLLQKRGYVVIATENGQEALAALDREKFDVILMDVQMPVMDGFEAIRLIRMKEQTTGAHIPIVALTAHAMKGDRERCISMGADDYVSKPIRTSDLFGAIDRSASLKIDAKLASPPNTEGTPDAGGAEPRVFDLREALARVEDDRELLEEIIRIFTSESAANMEAIRQAFSSTDAPSLERLAHTVKGAASNLSAFAISAAALKLEKLAHAGNLQGASDLIDALQREMDRLLPELAHACQKVSR
ncbi:MAG TPA: response regulator [Candidatus Aquilonibacter sp.]|nr:response regulator [Candidatus Aquilonibacter sp.]